MARGGRKSSIPAISHDTLRDGRKGDPQHECCGNKNGTITQSVKRKAAGTKGKLSFSVDFIKAVDGQSVPVNLKYEFAGKSKTAVAVAGAAVVAAPLLLIKGKPAIIKEGTIFNALVVGDKKIKLE